MGNLKASPLHLISGVINATQLHQDFKQCPIELTERCIHLLEVLSKSREFAIQVNEEMLIFLTESVPSCNDIGYMKLTRYFVRELLALFKPQHKLWGAISYVMLSVTPCIPEGDEREAWKRMNARFFEVLLDSGVISNEEEQRLKVKSSLAEPEDEAMPSLEEDASEEPEASSSPSLYPTSQNAPPKDPPQSESPDSAEVDIMILRSPAPPLREAQASSLGSLKQYPHKRVTVKSAFGKRER